jgi:hypothetical protein
MDSVNAGIIKLNGLLKPTCRKNDNSTLNIHHQSSEAEPMLLSVWISLNEQLELHVLLQTDLSHERLDLDHSYMDSHFLIVLFY